MWTSDKVCCHNKYKNKAYEGISNTSLIYELLVTNVNSHLKARAEKHWADATLWGVSLKHNSDGQNLIFLILVSSP